MRSGGGNISQNCHNKWEGLIWHLRCRGKLEPVTHVRPMQPVWLREAARVVHQHCRFQNKHVASVGPVHPLNGAVTKATDRGGMRDLVHITANYDIPRSEVQLAQLLLQQTTRPKFASPCISGAELLLKVGRLNVHNLVSKRGESLP
eukprot:7341486-Prymnesium_polylepis.2